ncbi:MAG TPA: DUF3825 domain-containing protein [Firmicutes bacterium]|nr:DUF3825 domain-containing protein [Bacillota bacterium]
MDEKTKKKIFAAMSQHFEVPATMPLARMARFLHENGIVPKAMGYAKMLDLLQDLPECLTLEKQPGGRDYMVHLHAFTRPKKDPTRRVLDKKEKERLRRIIQTYQKTPQFTGAQLCRWLQKEGRSSRCYGVSRLRSLVEKLPDVLGVASDNGQGDLVLYVRDRALSPEEQEKNRALFYDFLYLVPQQVQALSALINGREGTGDVWQMLADAFAKLPPDQKPDPGQEQALWHTGLRTEDGGKLILQLEKSRELSMPTWQLIGWQVQPAPNPLREAFDAFAVRPEAARRALVKESGDQTEEEALERLLHSFEKYQHALPRKKGKVILPFKAADGRTKAAVFAKNRATGGPPWVLHFVGDLPAGGVTLENWADMQPWPAVLAGLAAMAQPEAWDFVENGRHNYLILRQYLLHTFQQAWEQGQITEQSGKAVFPLGLQNRDGQALFACFTPSGQEKPRWRFDHFAPWQGTGAIPAKTGYHTPSPFDPALPVRPEETHILFGHMERLPRAFWLSCCQGAPGDIYAALGSQPKGSQSYRAALLHVRRWMEEEEARRQAAVQHFRACLQQALANTQRAEGQPALCFYPNRRVTEWLLPLRLGNGEKVDAVLLLEKTQKGYAARTLLTPPVAYSNARLLGPVQAPWLTVQAANRYRQGEKPQRVEPVCQASKNGMANV